MVLLFAAAAVLDREFLVSRERERKLHRDLEAASARLLHAEQLNLELKAKQDQLVCRIQQQQVNRAQVRLPRRPCWFSSTTGWDI